MSFDFHICQNKIVKKADLKSFKDLCGGSSALEIANRIIGRYRPSIEPVAKRSHTGGTISINFCVDFKNSSTSKKNSKI